MDGAQTPAGARAHPGLRRILVIAALAAAGWLLGLAFAATATADPAEPPPAGPPADGPVTEDVTTPVPGAQRPVVPAPAPADDTGTVTEPATDPVTDPGIKPATDPETAPATESAVRPAPGPAGSPGPDTSATPAAPDGPGQAAIPAEVPDAASTVHAPVTARPAEALTAGAAHAMPVSATAGPQAPGMPGFADPFLVPAPMLVEIPAPVPAVPGDGLFGGATGHLTTTFSGLTQVVFETVQHVGGLPPGLPGPPPGVGPDGGLGPDLGNLGQDLGPGFGQHAGTDLDFGLCPGTGQRPDVPTQAPASPVAPVAVSADPHPAMTLRTADPDRTIPPAPRPRPAVAHAPTQPKAQAVHADPGSEQPVKTPVAPSAPCHGSSASCGHDSGGSARGTYAVVSAQTTFPPPSAGLTTRSRATESSGRVAGLPATAPD